MVHLSGLRKRASYDELINYINTDKTKLRYPNRKATFLANSPQISSLLELDEMDIQDKEITKAKVAVSLGAAPTRGAGVNAAVQATTGTKDKEAQATTGTKNKEAQAIPETKDYSDYFNTAFHIDMANVIEDRSEHAGRPVDLWLFLMKRRLHIHGEAHQDHRLKHRLKHPLSPTIVMKT